MSHSADKPRLSLSIKGKKKSTATRQILKSDVQQTFGYEEPETRDVVINDDIYKEPLVIPAAPNKFGVVSAKPKNDASAELSAADKEALRALEAQAHGETRTSEQNSKDLVIQSSRDTFQRETQQFKADVEELPDALESAEYARRVPIADFGAAMLRGMGWKDPEHDRSKKDKTDIEVMPRPHRLGLGAIPKMEEAPETNRKRSLRPDQVKQRARLEEQQKEFAAERERQLALDKQRTMQNGSLVALRDGSRARIIQLVGVPGLNMVKVRRERDVETCVLKRGDILSLLSRQELDQKPFNEPEIAGELSVTRSEDSTGVIERTKSRVEKRRREEDSKQKDGKGSSKRNRDGRADSSSQRLVWAIPNIRVRIVSERLGKKYFKEKGIVVDVTRKGVTLKLDKSGVVLDRIPEDYLETALPKSGGNVVVLAGRHKYAKGKLLERDSRSAKGVVQIFEELNVLTLSLDDLAEFVGSLDDDMDE